MFIKFSKHILFRYIVCFNLNKTQKQTWNTKYVFCYSILRGKEEIERWITYTKWHWQYVDLQYFLHPTLYDIRNYILCFCLGCWALCKCLKFQVLFTSMINKQQKIILPSIGVEVLHSPGFPPGFSRAVNTLPTLIPCQTQPYP